MKVHKLCKVTTEIEILKKNGNDFVFVFLPPCGAVVTKV